MNLLTLNLKSFFTHWKTTIIFCLTIALLAIFAGLFGNFILNGQSDTAISIAIVDEDKTFESKAFYQILTGMDAYKNIIVFEKLDRQTALEKINSNEATAAFIIASGFTDGVKNGENKPFEVVYNGNAQVKAALVKYFADSFTQMLKTSQAGVYAGLDYAQTSGQAGDYDIIFKKINTKYMSLILNRTNMLTVEETSQTGGVSAFVYYVAAFYVFIMFAGVTVFSNIFITNFTRSNLANLNRLGTKNLKILLFNIVSFFAIFATINTLLSAIYFAAQSVLKLPITLNSQSLTAIVLGAMLAILCVSCFATFVTFWLNNMFSIGIFVTMYSLFNILISGGIVPLSLFPTNLLWLSKLSPNYYLANLFKSIYINKSDYSAFVGFLICCAIYVFAAYIAVCKKGGDLN